MTMTKGKTGDNVEVTIYEKKQVLETMWKIRILEEEIAKKYPEGKMRCPTHLSIGQEAVPSALSLCITKKDTAVSTHRCHAHYIAKGGNINNMVAEIYGKETGCSKGRGGSMHLIDKSAGFMGSSAIVGNSIPIGTGIALKSKLKKEKNISIVYMGEGATEEGSFYESINFAALKGLNVLYICENNLYSVYSPLQVRQPPTRNIVELVKSMGIKRASKSDGNDPTDCLRKLKEVVKEMREDPGPSFMEFKTYRWREHCGPNYDNDLGYRTKEEFERWKKRDPITIIEKEIMSEDCNYEKTKREAVSRIREEVKEAFIKAESAAFPDPRSVEMYVYKKS